MDCAAQHQPSAIVVDTRRRVIALCVCVAFAIPGALACAVDGPGKSMPGDVVLEFATSSPQTGALHVHLRVRSCGLVEAWPEGLRTSCLEQRRPEDAARLVADFQKVLDERSLTSESIQAELRAESARKGLSFQIAGADDSVLTVITDKGRSDVRCPAVGLLVSRFPDAVHLREFSQLQQRSQNLGCVVQCGGREKAAELCTAANQKLQAEYPAAARWTIDELTMIRTLGNGSRFVQFRRAHQNPDIPGSGECWTTCIYESPGRPTQVTVLPPPSLLQ